MKGMYSISSLLLITSGFKSFALVDDVYDEMMKCNILLLFVFIYPIFTFQISCI